MKESGADGEVATENGGETMQASVPQISSCSGMFYVRRDTLSNPVRQPAHRIGDHPPLVIGHGSLYLAPSCARPTSSLHRPVAAVCGQGFLISAGPLSPDSANAGRTPHRHLSPPTTSKTLGVGKMSWANDIRAAMALWEGLATYDITNNLKPRSPVPPNHWNISADGKTLHLPPPARKPAGPTAIPSPLKDFIFAWNRASLDAATGADYIGLFKSIEGAEEYAAALEELETPDPAKPGHHSAWTTS